MKGRYPRVIMNSTKGHKQVASSGSSDAHGTHHCCTEHLPQFMPTALWGPPSDELEEEEKAWFTDGLGQYVGRSEKWMVAILASFRGWGT